MKKGKQAGQAQQGQQENPSVSIEDFIIPQKVEAFVEMYHPLDRQTLTCEVFNEARLREFFKAIPLPGLGDPLVKYVELLDWRGYHMHVSLTGEPAIFCDPKK